MPQVLPSRVRYLCRYPKDLYERLVFKGMCMDVLDAVVPPSSVIPEWCNPSLLATDEQPLPASSRIDWLAGAMNVWCATQDERPEAPRRFIPTLNS